MISVDGIGVEIVRKAIGNMHLGVYPPEGRVRVAAPMAMGDEAVRLAVVGRLGWIKRQRAKFQTQARETEREMVSGESHYYQGRRHRLRVIGTDGFTRVALRNRSTIEMHAPRGWSAAAREAALLRWYRRQLKGQVASLLEKWQAKLGVRAEGWGIKRMKTRWGTCNPGARRIWLNLELAKKSPRCLEYIVVHELVHLIEPTHRERFIALMDRHLPHWRALRDECSGPLACLRGDPPSTSGPAVAESRRRANATIHKSLRPPTETTR